MDRLKQLRRVAWRLRHASRAEIHAAWRKAPVRPNVVLYESFSGNGMLCSPEAVFRYLISQPEFAHLIHVWAVRDPRDQRLQEEFGANPRVSFVTHGSRAYLRHLAAAGYLINNATFPSEFSKRPEQTYLNTWHGTPLKKMGYAMPDGAAGTRNILRNFLAADYLLSSSPFMTEQMYSTDYRLRNLFRGKIIEEGSPRTDRQLEPGAKADAVRLLQDAGLPVAGKRVMLYAPTWKGKSFYNPADQSEELAETISRIRSALPAGWVVLAKTHQIVYDTASRSSSLRDCLVPNDIPANLVLAATDALVTDYSSIFFDFLLLDRPIVFYLPDKADYEESRGLYVPPAELPGHIATTGQELTGAVQQATDGQHEAEADRDRRLEWVAKYAPYDDGHVTERVVDVVFKGSQDYRLKDISSDGRERILAYLGPMKSMGITTSGLNLLANLDHDRFDVSAFYLHANRGDRARNAAAIDTRVRHIPRIGGMNGFKLMHLRRHLLQEQGVRTSVDDAAEIPVSQLFRDEWTRCFGDAEFDYIIDFSGYGPLWDFILLQGKGKSHSIWLHNDMHADARREVHGRRHLYKKLHSVFSTYRLFDNLVSVSEELSRVNSRTLSEFADPEAFGFAHNTINHDRIRSMAELEYPPVEPGEWKWRPSEAGEITFVTVGRLSTEKNHERLIRAFAEVHAEHPRTRLILLGDGPLAEHLAGVVASLSLGDCVELAGFQKNPYPALGSSDCFVLSSDHEGQPMVILEALTLGLPVVITDFSSSKGALPSDTGLIVERSVDGLVSGMNAFIDGQVPNPGFDPIEYNKAAMSEFYRAIGAGDVVAT